ncbi:hypothetical protein [Nocardia sp. CY41]|uniref:hypothetical protein n=1 Tax=Nocardia sp. CY41 TaxID=2608686 RepID=UPI00135BEA1D|nr:hypothetical protein [Nocardia sp. CY41]
MTDTTTDQRTDSDPGTSHPGRAWTPDIQRLEPLADLLDDSATIGAAVEPDLVWSWRHMPRQRALAAWFELIDWVEWWRRRYVIAQITGCWYRHPPVVEHLWALMVSHRRAYRPKTAPEDVRDDPMDWHTQRMWPCLRAIADAGYLTGCNPNDCRGHETHTTGLYRDSTHGGVEEAIVADLADRVDAPADQPTMSAEDMTRAFRVGLAEPIDASRPDDSLRYEGSIWDFDSTEQLYRRRPDSES